jgi:cell wall-associated NlpC family hydrolase
MKSLDQLETIAATWVGTPFCEQSAVKGAGVCCHMLPLEIYFEAEWLPRFVMPRMAPGVASFEKTLRWFEGGGAQFVTAVETAAPGDSLHFQLGRTSHFMLMLRGGRFIHTSKSGADYAEGIQPAWLKRLKRIWRVK